jgi:acyl-CoA-binding protein
MQQYAELIHVLNDLIRINTDRIGELKKRINDLGNNSEIVPLFKRLMKESVEFKEQLIDEAQKKGGAVITNVVGNSGIYDAWKELKGWLQQKNDLSILEMVQFDIKAALMVYKEAVFVVENIPADTLDLIATQKAHLREDWAKIETELILNNSRTNFI